MISPDTTSRLRRLISSCNIKMTVKKRKLNSQKVSNSKHKIMKKGTSLRSLRTIGARTGKYRSRSNSKLNSNISKNTQDSTSSEQNIIVDFWT